MQRDVIQYDLLKMKPLLRRIAANLSTRDRVYFSSSCSLFREVIAMDDDLTKMNAIFSPIIKAVKRGKLKRATKLLTANPGILIVPFTFTDLSKKRKHIDRTLFQFVLGGEDVEFVEMMIPLILSLPNGKEELSRQIYEQFPEEIAEHKCDFSFDKLITAFDKTTSQEVEFARKHPNVECPLNAVIHEFESHVGKQVNVTAGSHCNVDIFRAALELFCKKSWCGNLSYHWSSDANFLFGLRILAFMTPLLPVSYMQLVFKGFEYRHEGQTDFTPISRSLKTKKFISWDRKPYHDNISPLDPKAPEKLGVDYFIETYSGSYQNNCRGVGTGMLSVASKLKKHMEIRRNILNVIRQKHLLPQHTHSMRLK